ncbi:paraquat-inducible protein A [Thiofilum flexile]|uniref:paraquat-inducible protein A n=1 Tax=Thiofilum flexile TaxID=125627 RepID=UPI0003752390|nr:paraquat-inducible protein A [Thiofilum flexile]
MTLIPRLIFNALLLLALGLFLAGVFAPLIELEKLWIFKNIFSLASSLEALWAEREFALFAVLGLFSIVTPIIKIVVLGLVVNTSQGYRERHHLWISFLEIWGKWSMLDVFVVALMLVAVKLGPLAHVVVHQGVYLFTGAVLLMQFLSVWLHWVLKRQAKISQSRDLTILKS